MLLGTSGPILKSFAYYNMHQLQNSILLLSSMWLLHIGSVTAELRGSNHIFNSSYVWLIFAISPLFDRDVWKKTFCDKFRKMLPTRIFATDFMFNK